MDIKRSYGVTVDVHLKSLYWKRYPTVKVSLNGQVKDVTVDKDMTVSFVTEAQQGDLFTLSIEHYGKIPDDHDTINNLDTAVIVDRITLNGIDSRRFVWEGIYEPQYDESYVEEYRRNGIELQSKIRYCNYLGWNGVWSMQFTAPVFTWIHNLENLGWIYD